MKIRRRGSHAKSSLTGLLLQQSFLVTVSSGISAAGGFLAWSIAAHAATPHTVGMAVGLFTSCSLLSYLTSLALPYGLLRYGRSPAAVRILGHALWVTAATSVVGAAVFALGSPWWAPALSSELVHAGGLMIYAISNVAIAGSVVMDSYFVSRGRASVTCVRNVIAAIGKVGTVIVLAVSHKSYVDAIYAAMIVPVAASMLCVAPFIGVASLLFSSPPGLIERAAKDDTRAFFEYSFKTYPGALLDGAPIFLLPVLALRLIGPTLNAYFYVAWSIAGVVGLVSAAVGQIVLRESVSAGNQHDLERRAKSLSIIATALAVLILALLARLVVEVFGSHYAMAIVPLQIMLLSMLPAAHLTITIAMLRGRKLYRAVNWASVGYAVLSVGFAVVLGAIGGITGLCLGWLVGVSLSAVLGALIAARQTTGIAGREIDVVTSVQAGGRHAA